MLRYGSGGFLSGTIFQYFGVYIYACQVNCNIKTVYFILKSQSLVISSTIVDFFIKLNISTIVSENHQFFCDITHIVS
jgi:hypothetical protein